MLEVWTIIAPLVPNPTASNLHLPLVGIDQTNHQLITASPYVAVAPKRLGTG